MKVYENTPSLSNTTELKPTWIEQRLIERLQPLLNQDCGTLHLTLPSGVSCKFGRNAPEADVKLHNLMPLARLFFGGINGWSESYLKAEWDSHDIAALVKWALTYEDALSSFAKAGFIKQSLHNFYHWRRDNSKKGSRKNIAAHYDLGNDFYKHWLDPSMTYSAALYAPKQEADETLEQAQWNKYNRILELLEAEKGQHIVEVGCGWGGFAKQASTEKQLSVHGITLSKEQLKWAKQVNDNHDQSSNVHLSLTDYRDLNHQYDGVVSIEMFEAVGEAHWDTYFQTLKKVLKPGGRAVLQIITIDDKRFETYRKQADFIQRYVFPGGMLPSISALQNKITANGFELKQKQLFGRDYARTLREWRALFESKWDQISQQGFDERFRRLWRYYLTYCEGGFEHGSIDVGFYVIEHAKS